MTGISEPAGGTRAQKREPLSLPVKVAYGVGQLAEGVKNASFEMVAFFYYSQVLELSGALTGLALFIAICFDAISDPVIGVVSDNFRSKWGRRHPFMYAAALPLAISFILFFNPPADLSTLFLFLWLTVFAILVRGSMTLYHVPHMAQGAELSDDYTERTSLVAYRSVFSAVGRLMVVIGGFGYFFRATDAFPNGQLNPDAYVAFSLVLAAAMAVTIFLSGIGTHKEIPRLHLPASRETQPKMSQHLAETLGALKNPSFRALFLGALMFFTSYGIGGALHLHMTTYFWELTPKTILIASLGGAAGLLSGTVLSGWIAHLADKRTIATGGALLGGFFFCLMPIARLVGLAPENGSSLLVILLFGFGMASAFCSAQTGVALGSMMADVADENELETGKRQEGVFFGGLAFAIKAAAGFGGMFAGLSIDFIDFPLGTEPGTVPAETLTALGIFYGPGVALCWILASFLLSRYELTKDKHANVMATLTVRRAQQ